MINFPNAKINLGLYITEKRKDGFHNLESIFLPIPIIDLLEIIPSPDGEFRLFTSGLIIDENSENNICVKAYRLIKTKYDIPEVHIYLHKIIPTGAGLGGGSSDAVSTLKMLNQLFELNISVNDLLNMASVLGSDCSFFVANQAAFVMGKGDNLQQVELPEMPDYLVVVQPQIHIPSGWAFSKIIPKVAGINLSQIKDIPISQWKDLINNEFEKPMFALYPEIQNIKNNLYKNSAVYASMSGSGSAVYGFFDKLPKIESLFSGMFYWEGKLKINDKK